MAATTPETRAGTGPSADSATPAQGAAGERSAPDTALYVAGWSAVTQSTIWQVSGHPGAAFWSNAWLFVAIATAAIVCVQTYRRRKRKQPAA